MKIKYNDCCKQGIWIRRGIYSLNPIKRGVFCMKCETIFFTDGEEE